MDAAARADGQEIGRRPDVVELRVHGVSGTPPEELLDRLDVRRVAGDGIAGFYRPIIREQWRDRPTNEAATDAEPYATRHEPDPPPLVEGYCWGGLTSGSPSRALWLILLPFTLANIAPRMRPVPGKSPEDWPRASAAVWFLSRLMALSLTLTLTLGASGIGLGILAWQCDQSCDGLGWPLQQMFAASTPWRVLWGSLFPLLVLAVLAALSTLKSRQYDLVRPLGMGRADPNNPPPPENGTRAEPRLGNPGFWYGRYPVARLRQLHLQGGVATVALTIVVAAPGSGAVYWIGIALAVAVGALVVGGLAWPGLVDRHDPPGFEDDRVSRADRARSRGWIRFIWWPVLALAVVAVMSVWSMPDDTGGSIPGYDGLISGLFVWQSVLSVAMLVLVGWMALRERRRVPRRAMWSLGTVVMTILGLYLGAAMTSGFVVLSASWINSSGFWVSPADVLRLLEDRQIVVPDSFRAAGLGTFLVAVAVAVIGVITAIWAVAVLRVGGGPADRRHAAESEERARGREPVRFQQLTNPTGRAARRRSIANATWIARRVDYLAGFLSVVVLVIGVIGSILTILYGFSPSFRAAVVPAASTDGPDLAAIGIILIGALTVGLVVLGAIAFRVPQTRKAVGIVWDIGAFWPRDVHPLAPPCYAERAVPELSVRLRAHCEAQTELMPDLAAGAPGVPPDAGGVRADAGRGGAGGPDGGPSDLPLPAAVDLRHGPGLVVLAAHSQGTVISMAALLGPGKWAADRTALLTFGTVLRRLYARFFPLYFSREAFAALGTALGGGAGAEMLAPWPMPGDARTAAVAGLVPPTLRWRNLWRRTDYLGGRLGDPLSGDDPPPAADGLEQIDILLNDPLFLPVPGDTTVPAAGRHSNFPRDPGFQQTLTGMVDRARLDPAMGDQPLPSVGDRVMPDGNYDELMNPRAAM